MGTTPLTSMMINMGSSDPVSLSYYYEELSVGERRNRKITCSQGHLQQQIKLVSTNHCSTQG